MSQAPSPPETAAENSARPPLCEAAKRALAEAAERRSRNGAAEDMRPREVNGRRGPEPVRYGDWEVKGLAVDF